MLRILIVSVLSLQFVSAFGCQDSHGHVQLDLTRYQGTWNLIGFVEPEPFIGQKHRCVSESYNFRIDNPYLLDTLWNGTIKDERVSQSGLITLPSTEASDASSWQMYMDGGKLHRDSQVPNAKYLAKSVLIVHPTIVHPCTARFESSILATDYVDWAIERTCAVIPVMGQPDYHFERVMIRGRNTYLSTPVLQTLLTLVESYGYDSRNFVYIDHINCQA